MSQDKPTAIQDSQHQIFRQIMQEDAELLQALADYDNDKKLALD